NRYSYGLDGRILSKSDVGGFTYGAGQPHAVTQAGTRAYAYDGNGNQITRPRATTGTFLGSPTVLYSDLDQPKAFLHGNWGTRQDVCGQAGSGNCYCATDATGQNEICSDNADALGYDGEQQRVLKATGTSETTYVYGLYERVEDRTGNAVQHRFYVPSPQRTI